MGNCVVLEKKFKILKNFIINNINEVIEPTQKYVFCPFLNKQAVLRGK